MWKSRYGMPYMHCGCPLPGDTIGQKLNRLVHFHGQQPAFLIPPNDPDALAGTHPSDHNAVFALHQKGRSDLDRNARLAKFIKRRQRDAELSSKGNGPGNSHLFVHHPEIAFLTPIPLFVASAGCVSWGGGVDGKSAGCAAVSFLFVCLLGYPWDIEMYVGQGAGGCTSSSVGPCGGGGMESGEHRHSGGGGDSGGGCGGGGGDVGGGGGGGDGGGGGGCGGGGGGGCGGGGGGGDGGG
jgi:hypothetical protein